MALRNAAVGRLASETDFNGRTLRYAYDAAGRLSSRTNGAAETLLFQRDTLGRSILTRTDDGAETTHAYDDASRLISAVGPGTAVHRTYDSVGRLLTEAVDGRTSTYTYDARGHRTSRVTPSGAFSEWTYDAEGRPSSLTTAGHRLAFGYDEAGRESCRSFGPHTVLGRPRPPYRTETEQQLRDHTGLAPAPPLRVPGRTAKYRVEADGTVADRTNFTWDGTRLVEQCGQDGHTTTWNHRPGTHRPVTQVDHHTQAAFDARFHAIVTNLVGTPTELVTPDGRVAWQNRTTVWGTALPAADPGSADCPLRFPGQYSDPETGLDYNGFRYYDAEIAGYISADPLGLSAAPHHHAYVPNPFGWPGRTHSDSSASTPIPRPDTTRLAAQHSTATAIRWAKRTVQASG
ncbi:RHS repeat-associated core domain-containing protein [Streptomyces sp. NPDC003943]